MDEFMMAHRGEKHHGFHRPNMGQMTDWERHKLAAWETFHDHSNPLVQFGHRVIFGASLGITGAVFISQRHSFRYSSYFSDNKLVHLQRTNFP